MGTDADVIVVGGGPAGIATAMAATEKGMRVIVADGAKPPVVKACGEGLMPEAAAWLIRFGVTMGETERWPLGGIRFVNGDSTFSAKLPNGTGIGVRREVLHRRMVERATERGVVFLWNAPVTDVTAGGAIAGGKFLRARWIVGADGAQSRVRRWSGLESRTPRTNRFAIRRHYCVAPWSDFTEIHWGDALQAYATPVNAQEICVVLISNSPHARFEEYVKVFPTLAERLAGAEVVSTERGAVTNMFELKRVQLGNVALVGDASGSVDAITGEGLALSFLEASALADALAAGDLSLYQNAHRKLFRRPRLMGNILLLLGRKNGIRGRAFRAFEKVPQLFDRLLAFHVGELGPLQLAAAGARYGWQLLES